MGRLARLLSFIRTAISADAKVDPGGGPVITAQHFQPAGDDAHPLPDDYAVLLTDKGTGREMSIGYLDSSNGSGVADAGEKRIYARESSGSVVVQLHLKNDGSATLFNDSGSITLLANGSVNINGAIIDTNGEITSPVRINSPSMVANSKELDNHTHNILSGSSAPGPTGGNN